MNTLPKNISHRPEHGDTPYRVRFQRDGKRQTIGYYATEQEAVQERDAFLEREQEQARLKRAYSRLNDAFEANSPNAKNLESLLEPSPHIDEWETKKASRWSALGIIAPPKTLEETIAEYAQQAHSPAISGATLAKATIDTAELWERAIAAQRETEAHQARKAGNQITLPHEPCAIAFLSDQHIGSAGTDYASMKRDAETVRDAPGMYAIMHGDLSDNWIIGKLTALQAGQSLNGDAEIALFRDYLNMLKAKLLIVVPGNHDLWTKKIARIEPIAEALAGLNILYDKFQVDVKLIHGSISRMVAIRHKWRFNSVFNPTHGLEVGWERGGVNYDWAVGGHTHIGTYFRDFHRHGKRRTAILTGAYKRVDAFADEIGFAPCADNGCGAIVLHPDGREWSFTRLDEAAEFLAYLRGK